MFDLAGLNPATLSITFTSIATSMTTTRTDLRSTTGEKVSKTEKNYSMRQKDKEDNYGVPFRRETYDVCRYVYSPDAKKTSPEAKIYDWKKVPFINYESAGFDIDKDPFGKVSHILCSV